MRAVLTTDEVTELENIIERQGKSKAELMEHAGEHVARIVADYGPKRVLVLTGFGNNVGD